MTPKPKRFRILTKKGKTKLEARFLKAALSSDLKEVSKCLNAGVNVNAYVGGTFTILHIAAERGDMPLGIRLARCPDLNYNIKSLRGNTPLILAVLTRSRKFVKFLLKNGADPDIGDFLEKTPFHHVCRLQAIDLAFDLLKYNANIDAVDVFGNTPLGVALLGVNFVPMAKLLLKHGADTNPMTERSLPLFLEYILICKTAEQMEGIELLLNHGADIDMQDDTGKTGLHIVGLTGFLPLASLLLKRGASMTIKDVCGRTAVEVAKIHSNFEVYDMLAYIVNKNRRETSSSIYSWDQNQTEGNQGICCIL